VEKVLTMIMRRSGNIAANCSSLIAPASLSSHIPVASTTLSTALVVPKMDGQISRLEFLAGRIRLYNPHSHSTKYPRSSANWTIGTLSFTSANMLPPHTG
jgi:hypothetical protein